MTTMRMVVIAVAFLLFVGADAAAQSSIAGTVRDTTGGVMPGVTVEVTSPALIEKVRTAVTDGTGQYRVVDLRPGTYTVTFTLPGFTTVKREGIELTALFTAPVNAEMLVGDVAETVTVSGQSPVVDIQNVVKQREITRDVLDAIPRGSAFQNLITLIPGAVGVRQDVGGQAGPQFGQVRFHGGRGRDGQTYFDGAKITNLPRNDATNFMAQDETIQEYNVQIGSQSAENETSGIHTNIIPREGANAFHGSLFANFANDSLESTNYTDELKSRGLGSPSRVKQLYDVNPTLGGPIKQNTLWFYTGVRKWSTERSIPGRFYNTDVSSWAYVPDLSRPAVEVINGWSTNLHLTWNASPKNRFRFYYDKNDTCLCTFGLAFGPRSPEATQYMQFLNSLRQLAWTAPVTKRLLFEAHASWFPQGNPRDPQPDAVAPSITEQSTGLVYRSGFGVQTPNRVDQFRASASYITGAHAFKVGFSWVYEDMRSGITTNEDVNYRVLNGVPNLVSYYATPIDYEVFLHNKSLFAQDQWTISRLTLNTGLRFDNFMSGNRAIDLPPARYFPFPRVFPETEVANWNDLSPRMGAAYDLFGTAKTVLKGNVSKYVNQEGNDLAGLANPLNPPGCCSASPVSSRSWSDANGDFVVQGDPFNPAANGELGPGSDLNFGKTVSRNRLDPNLTNGFGVRGYNWEAAAGIQHELLPRVSADFTYYWRWQHNFYITDNAAVGPGDFSPYCITAPVDSRLPGGGGQQICGLYDVNPAVFGRIDNFVTHAKNYGTQQEQWHGFDVTINTRLQNGILLQGGVSSGRTMTDNCEVVTEVDNPSTRFCHNEEPFLTQIKFLGSYPLPWWGLQLSGTFQNAPGDPISANYVARSASIRPSLGRDLSTGANSTVSLTFASWNRIALWLRQLNNLRAAA